MVWLFSQKVSGNPVVANILIPKDKNYFTASKVNGQFATNQNEISVEIQSLYESSTTFVGCFEIIYTRQQNAILYCCQDKFVYINWNQFLMLSQIFCYWDKQQSAESNITRFHLTLKCMKDQFSHFCDCVLDSKWIFQLHDPRLTKFYTQDLTGVCRHKEL